jgi:pimeloyl-ACP methyl ester carboxylesterase
VNAVPPPGLEFTEPPPRIREGLRRQRGKMAAVEECVASLPETAAPRTNQDGDTEMLGSTKIVHRFIDSPGDSETVRWHFVECGPSLGEGADAETAVFLHGLPDSWWQWHYALEELGSSFRCLAIDLKGYGQSEKHTGDFRQRGVAEQLAALLDQLGVGRFSVISHDRGSPVADHLVAMLGTRVVRYGRGQQHLWHLHPDLHPQEALLTSPDAPAMLSDARRFVCLAYSLLTERPVSPADLARTVEEFSHPGISTAVPRYFNSSSFRQEWIDRRNRLVREWKCPVLLLQGADDPLQPREFYTDELVLEQLPAGSGVHLLDAGHFWPFEAPAETVDTLRRFLNS